MGDTGDVHSTVRRIRSRIRQRNGELILDSAIELGLGMLYIALLYGTFFALAWVGSWMCILPWLRHPTLMNATLVAGGATLVLFAATSFAAWRDVQPFGRPSISEGSPADAMSMNFIEGRVHPEHATAGARTVLTSGPRSLFSAIATLRHRVRASGRSVRAAAELLHRIGPGLPLSDVSPTEARSAVILRRLMLIKLGGLREDHLMLTAKGEAVRDGAPTS